MQSYLDDSTLKVHSRKLNAGVQIWAGQELPGCVYGAAAMPHQGWSNAHADFH